MLPAGLESRNTCGPFPELFSETGAVENRFSSSACLLQFCRNEQHQGNGSGQRSASTAAEWLRRRLNRNRLFGTISGKAPSIVCWPSDNLKVTELNVFSIDSMCAPGQSIDRDFCSDRRRRFVIAQSVKRSR
jgi:hypothetical protein